MRLSAPDLIHTGFRLANLAMDAFKAEESLNQVVAFSSDMGAVSIGVELDERSHIRVRLMCAICCRNRANARISRRMSAQQSPRSTV